MVCVIRGDVKRSIVFDVVGYDTAVARGDLLFFFFFCFSFRFSRDWTIEKDCSKKDCATLGNRHECGGGSGGDRKLRI